MKLSEAILMGRHLVKPCAVPSQRQEANGGGCALTMAVLAVGGKADVTGCLWTQSLDIWPWLHDNGDKGAMNIATKFDRDVIAGRMTIEQLADYVRSIEPADNEPDPRDEEGSDVRPELEVYKGR